MWLRAIARTSLLVVTVVGLAACGGETDASDDPRAAALEVVHRYQDASIARDGAAVCSMFTGEKKQEVVSGTAVLGGITSCEDSIKRVLDLEGGDDLAARKQSREATTASNVVVTGDRAKVTFPSGTTLDMMSVGGDWFIDVAK